MNKKSLPVEMDKKKLTKFLRSGASFKAKENVSPEIGKPTRSAFTCAKRALLRSSKKKGISILKNNVLKSNVLTSNGNKIKTRRSSKTLLQLPLKDISDENERQKILQNSLLTEDDVSQGNRKEDDEQDGEMRSGKEKAILDPASGSIDMVSNDTTTEKNSNEEKLVKPFKKEYLKTRKMQNVIPMKKNDYKCLPQTVADVTELDNPKPDEVSMKKDEPKECIIICTPDININVCSKDTVIFRDNNEKLENREDESDLEFVKTSLTQLENEAIHLKSKSKYSQYSKKLCHEIFDESPKQKLKHVNVQQMPVFESRMAKSINENRSTINGMESLLLPESKDECNDAGGRQNEQEDEDPLALQKELKISFKEISIFKTRSKSTNYNSSPDKIENGNKLLNIESVVLPQTKNKTNNVGCKEDKQEEEDPYSLKKESGIYLKDVSLLKNNSKRTDSKYLHTPFSDSDATLSNVESIESSPDDFARKTWPVVADDNSNVSQKLVKRNPGPKSASQCDVNSILQRIPAEIRVKNITGSMGRDSKSSGITRKHSKMNESNILHSSTEEQESEPQYHVESLPNQDYCCSAKNNEKYTKDVENYDNNESVSWLRHYERPRKTEMEKAKSSAKVEANEEETSVQKTKKLYHGKKNIATFEKISDAATNQVLENKHHGKKQAVVGYALRERNENLPNTTVKTAAKRGRPRKEKTEQTESNLKKTKKAQLENTNSQLNNDLNAPIRDRSDTDERANRPSVKIVSTLNGSALTMLELQHLFFKFLQHGHFRIDVEQPIINNHNSNYPNFATRFQCYDQKDYYMPSDHNTDLNNLQNTAQPQLQKSFQTNDRSSNGVYHTNASSFNQTDHSRFRSVDPNLHNKFSNEFDKMSYSGNAAGVSSHQNSGADVMTGNDMSRSNTNSWNHNSTLSVNTSSVSNSFQSGYTTAPSYQHNFYNSSDALANNFYSNCYPGSLNPNDSSNNVNFGTETVSILSTTNNIISDINVGQSTPSQYQNSIPHVELDTTMSNGNRVSNISMQDLSMNDLNAVWNLSGVNQPLDSLNEFSMNLSTMSCGNETSQPIDGITDMKSLSYDSNRVINGSDVWMNRANTSMNSGFSVLRPWQGSLPMYNPYLNDNKIHYGSMFSPCGAFTGLDLSNYSYLNTENSADLWAQNTFIDVDKNSTTDISNAQFSGMSSGSSPQENNFISNKAMNLSLPASALCDTTTVETNVRNSSGDNLDVENRNELNSTTEPLQENTTAVLDVNYNNNMQEISQISDPYSFEYENGNQNLNFNGTSKVSTDPENNSNNQQQQNQLEIYDSVNQRLENLTDCFDENYSNAELPNCKTLVAQSNTSETEFSKLRKELAHFTKQWSEK